jgi:hypothetical protein
MLVVKSKEMGRSLDKAFSKNFDYQNRCCLSCFIPIVKCCLQTDFDYGLLCLLHLDIGLMVGVIKQGMFSPPKCLIQPLVYPSLNLVVFRGTMRD